MANTINFSNTTPAAPTGQTNVTFQVDASTTPNLSAYVPTQVNADWSAVSGAAQILNKPTLATVATSGSYTDLSSLPTLGTAAAQPTNAFDAAGAATAAVAAIPVFGPSGGSHSTGFVPDPGATAGSTRYLREDATWGTPAGGAVTSVFGRTGAVAAVATDYPAFVASGASHAPGMVPDPGATTGSTKYLREDGTWAVAAQLSGTNTWTNAQTFSQTATFSLSVRMGAFAPACRTVVTATDTASVNTDHTLILNGVTTESLPAAPSVNFEYHIVNINATAATISGNGKNIWVNGVSAASISLAPNSSIVLQYDLTNTIWRAIGDTGGAAAALLSANNTWSGTQTISSASASPGATVQVLAPSLSGAGSVSVGLGSAIGSGTSGFLVWYNGSGSSFLSLETYAGARPVTLNPSGRTLVGTFTDNGTDTLQVAGSASISGVVKVGSVAPATSTSAGVTGSITWDSGFLYIAVATNTWKRVALTTF